MFGITKLKKMRYNNKSEGLQEDFEKTNEKLLKLAKEIQDVDYEIATISKSSKKLKIHIKFLEDKTRKSKDFLIKKLTERLKLSEKFVFRNLI